MHIFQAGVAADRIYDPDLGEDEDEFLWVNLLEEVRWKYVFVDPHEYGLTLNDFRRGMREKGTRVTGYALETNDDYSLAFNSVIHHHWWHVRRGARPTRASFAPIASMNALPMDGLPRIGREFSDLPPPS